MDTFLVVYVNAHLDGMLTCMQRMSISSEFSLEFSYSIVGESTYFGKSPSLSHIKTFYYSKSKRIIISLKTLIQVLN